MEQTGAGFLALPDNPDRDPTLVWREVFGNDQPVEVEIGIGKGRFIIDAASRQPAVNFVGVEWAAKYVRIARQRAARRNLGNVRFAHMDAREFVELFVAAASVRAYHIYFPDPWPKKRHHKRRLFNEEFLREVERTLCVGGQLWLATDYADYFDVMLTALETSSCLVEADASGLGRGRITKTSFSRRASRLPPGHGEDTGVKVPTEHAKRGWPCDGQPLFYVKMTVEAIIKESG